MVTLPGDILGAALEGDGFQQLRRCGDSATSRGVRSLGNHGDRCPLFNLQRKPLYNFISPSFVFDNKPLKIKSNISLAYTLL